jgi:hypothetical protein
MENPWGKPKVAPEILCSRLNPFSHGGNLPMTVFLSSSFAFAIRNIPLEQPFSAFYFNLPNSFRLSDLQSFSFSALQRFSLSLPCR